MNKIERTQRHFRAYALGEPCEGLPVVQPHAFDLNKEDAEVIIAALECMRLLTVFDYPHNFQRERFDLRDYCFKMTALQRAAKAFLKENEL